MESWERNFKEEFKTVDLFVNSGERIETKYVDAFALTLIKTERQLRRIFTHLTFQFTCFTDEDIPEMIKVLAECKRVYMQDLIVGINSIYSPKTLKDVFEANGQNYKKYIDRLKEAIGYRHKIFHGQITGLNLSSTQLEEVYRDLRKWSEIISEEFDKEIGYDGFKRPSFEKSSKADLESRLREGVITSIDDYKKFIEDVMNNPSDNGSKVWG